MFLEPTQQIVFLGFTVNSTELELCLPMGKVKIRADIQKLLSLTLVEARKLSQIFSKQRGNKGDSAGPPVLLQFTDGPKQCFRPGLLGIPQSNSTNERGTAMVVGPSDFVEWQNTDSTEAITCD